MILYVKTNHHLRRLLTLICLAAVLLAALAPVTLGILFAFLIPFWFFFAAVVSFPVAIVDEDSGSPSCKNPIAGSDCCARTSRGRTNAALPRRVINFRRLMGSPPVEDR